MKNYFRPLFAVAVFILACGLSSTKRLDRTTAVTLETLLREMTDPDRYGRFPEPEYRSLQASSYNRASVSPDKPGWFADSDGIGYIREDSSRGRKEYIIMEHDGPGCLTRLWTPFFYYDFNNRVGPNVRIYLDGNKEPVIDENFIALLTGKGSVKSPFASFTARAGVSFLPIPFSKSCKITLDDRPFYNIINYRAYEKGTNVRTFSLSQYEKAQSLLSSTASRLLKPEPVKREWQRSLDRTIKAGDTLAISLPAGNHALRQVSIQLNADGEKSALRSAVLKIAFDGRQTVWCPVGDFFSTVEPISAFKTRNFSVTANGKMTCNWVMPYESSAVVSVINVHDRDVSVSMNLDVGLWNWDDRSMYFHANWSAIGALPGNMFYDLNFIDITGKGVLAGDALTVLFPGTGWWGEGDEKIYIDAPDVNPKFPSHFGTGTEDYYGWAGGVVPTGKDVFSMPFGSNVRVGNAENPRGYNVCLRNRMLDDVPFQNRLVFDMEASPGTDIRNHWNLISYSTVTYWYGLPGATSTLDGRCDLPVQLPSLDEMDRMQQLLKDSIIYFDPTKAKKLTR